jgi:hypothetical protein
MQDVLDVDERAAQGAYNQALFREVNERVRVLLADPRASHTFGPVPAEPDWVCECANTACMQRIAISSDEYLTVRADGARFLVAPGEDHVFADIEAVTDRHAAYWIVEKTGTARAVAKELAGGI